MRVLYVYYKVRAQDCAEAGPRVRALQALMASQTGVDTELLYRSMASQTDEYTWLEVYRNAPSDLEALLAQAVKSLALDPWIGARRVEHFIAFSP